MTEDNHVFQRTRSYLKRFICYEEFENAIVTAFIGHAWLWSTGALTYTPRLAILSPERECGKSTLLDILALLLPNAISSASMSPAAMYRIIEKKKPVLLFDEADHKFEQNPELINLINAGFKRGAIVYRTNKETMVVDSFNADCPLIFAAIDTGQLPDTVASRAIPIRMRRGIPKEKFRERLNGKDATDLAKDWEAWANRVKAKAIDHDPVMPGGIDGRKADKWESLFTVEDLVDTHNTDNTNVTAPRKQGGQLLRHSALVIETNESDIVETSDGSQLMKDIQTIVARYDTEYIFTRDIIDGLCRLEGTRWADFNWHGKPITSYQLHRLLRPYGIKPESEAIRIGGERLRGFKVVNLLIETPCLSPESRDVCDVRDREETCPELSSIKKDEDGYYEDSSGIKVRVPKEKVFQLVAANG
jgi:putative DNA primase/helicase